MRGRFALAEDEGAVSVLSTPAGQVDRLPPRLQRCGSRAAFVGLLRLLDNPGAPGLGVGASGRNQTDGAATITPAMI